MSKKSGWRALLLGIYFRSDKWIRAKVWLVTSIHVVVPLASGFLFPQPVNAYAIAIAMSMLFFSVLERCIQIHFRDQYKKYSISGHRHTDSRDLLHYALFVQQIEESQITKADMQVCLEWLSFDVNTDVSESALKHPLAASLLVIGTASINELMKASKVWDSGKGLYILAVLIAVLLLIPGTFELFRTGRKDDAKLRKFLTWYLIDSSSKSDVMVSDSPLFQTIVRCN